MRIGSKAALALALAVGTSAIVAAPAAAKKDPAAAAEKYDFSKDVQPLLADAQKALGASDVATAVAKLGQAKPLLKTADDRFFYSSLLYQASKITKDAGQEREALLGMVDSPRTSTENKAIINLQLYQQAATANDWRAAETYVRQAIAAGTTEPNAYPLLADTQVKQNRPADALQTLQTAIAAKTAKGEAVPEDWLKRGINIANSAKLTPQMVDLTYVWLKAYPSKTNWRDSLSLYRDANRMEGDNLLDVQRLMFLTQSMTGQADYLEYADSTYTRLPNEAKQAIDAGVAAGFVKLNAPGSAKEINDAVVKRIAADKASLGASAAQAKGPKGSGRLALATADSYASYGDAANALAMYQLALTKSDADKNVVLTRLALLQAKSGQKDAARQTLAQISGPRAALAKYIGLWLDQQA